MPSLTAGYSEACLSSTLVASVARLWMRAVQILRSSARVYGDLEKGHAFHEWKGEKRLRSFL